MLLSQCALAQEEQNASIYSWKKSEIIENYFLLQNDFDRVTNIAYLFQKKIYILSNTINIQSNKIFWINRENKLENKLKKIENRKKNIRNIVISSIATLFTVIGVDIWITRKLK